MKVLSRGLIFTLFAFFLLSRPVLGADFLSVAINEIAWMGTITSHNDEWIELYNNTSSEINLSGWKLISQDGAPEINLSGIISPDGFFLLERTDDNTVPNILADQIYTGALGNNGENLNLYNGSGNLVDSVNCGSGWLAGDNAIKQTMERKNPEITSSDSNNWESSQNPGGTPKAQNDFIPTQATEEQKVEREITVKEETSSPPPSILEKKEEIVIVYPSGIVINEILPSPTGPDETEEWIEILNENQVEIDLFNWSIADTTGGIKTYVFPTGTKISPQGFLILSRPTTKITLNNDGDGVSLSQPDGKIVETINYPKASQGQSYSRGNNNDWFWSISLTPASANIITSAENSNKKDVLEQANENSTETKGQLASLGEQLPKSSKSLLVFLSAFGISILCGLLILIIKKKLTK